MINAANSDAVLFSLFISFILLAAGHEFGRRSVDWPLSPEQTRHIAEVIGERIDPNAYDFSLEPYAPGSLKGRSAT